MVKKFYLKENQIKGLSFWFWYKEAVASVLVMWADIINSESTDYGDLLFKWAIVVLVMPLFIIVIPVYCGFAYERILTKQLKDENVDGSNFYMHSKSAIKHFTFITMLTGTHKK